MTNREKGGYVSESDESSRREWLAGLKARDCVTIVSPNEQILGKVAWVGGSHIYVAVDWAGDIMFSRRTGRRLPKTAYPLELLPPQSQVPHA